MACNRRLLAALGGVALIGAAPAGVDPSVGAALVQLAAKDLRVATVAYRLQTGAIRACPSRASIPGLIVQDASQYRADLRPAMAALFNLGANPAVTGVVPGGAAARAGIRAGDEVLALNGASLAEAAPAKRGKRADGDRFGTIVSRISAAFTQGQASFTLRRAGTVFTRTVVGAPACPSSVQLDLGNSRNAGADGTTVSISQGLVDFTRSDDELAFVLAHELSHNILGHRSFLDSTKGRGGLFGGGNTAAVLDTERQADYLGLYLVAWAGYDVSAAPGFWERIAKVGWLSAIFSDGSHDGNRTRARDLAREITEIRSAQAAGRPLTPNYAAFEATLGREL